MKILQVIEFFTPQCGGSVNSVYNLSKELAKNGYDVTIITTDFKFDKEYAKSIEKEHVTIIPFRCVINIGNFFVSPSIKKWLNENIKDFDIVHMHNFRSYQNSVVHHYAKKFDIPYILQAHGSLLPFFKKQRLKKLYDVIWGDKILKKAVKVIALTNVELDQYKQMGINEKRINIVPNGIDLTLYDHLPEKGTFRNKHKISPATKIILYLGRLHKIKGIDLLIDAFSEVLKEVPFSKLVIVGPDEGCLKILQNQAEETNVGHNIIFTGPLYGQDKLAAYLDANVYVLPSLYDAFPNTVLEACICGTPVIVTDKCGIADVIDQKLGYVVKYDEKELYQMLVKILENDDVRRSFGEEGKKLIRKQFDLNIIVKKIECIYEKCI